MTNSDAIEPQPGCATCRHLHANWLTCDAFPNGIPLLIQQGDFDHREPFPDDQGIQWAPRED